jgi:hypothetical protein
MSVTYVVEGSKDNIIPTPNGWPGFYSGDPNYKDIPAGIFNFNGTNLLFTPKISAKILVDGINTTNIDALNITSDGQLFLANMKQFTSSIGSITIFSKPVIKDTLTDQIVNNTGSKTVTIRADTWGFPDFHDTYTWLIDGEEKQSGPASTSVPIYDFRGSIIGYENITPFTIDGSSLSFTIVGSLLSAGNHTLTLRITTSSPSGATATTESISTITVGNNSLPSFTTDISTFNLFSNSIKTITVAASNTATYTWAIDGVNKQTSADPSFIVNGSTLSAGEHTLTVTATNVNGNSSSEATFMVNPVIIASVAKNSQINIINFPAGYLLRDAPGLIFTDFLGSFEFNTDAGILIYSPATGITSAGENLSMYSPTNPMGFATIVITILEYPVIKQGLPSTLALRQNETKLVSITAESTTVYKWYIDDTIEKQSGVSNSFTVIGDILTIGHHILRVDAINSNGLVSSSSTITVSASFPPPEEPTNVNVILKSLSNINISWTSSELVQYTFNLTDDSTFVNATGSSLNIPVIVGLTSGIQDYYFPLKPQYSKIRLRAINENGASISVTQDISMPYTIEKRSINFGGVTDQYIITAFNIATEEISIISGITDIYNNVDTLGDLSIQNITKKVIFNGYIQSIGSEAFKNCSMLESITFVGAPPIFTNIRVVNGIETGYWNFAPNRLPAKVNVNYDYTNLDWIPVVSRVADPVSPYIKFSAPPFIYEQPPLSATVALGAEYQLVSKVNGSPLEYKWFEDGHEIAGAIAPTFTIKKTAVADLGVKQYFYQAYNDLGNKTSDAITITFVSPPILSSELPTGIALLEADSRAIDTLSVSGTAPIAYQWNVNGAPITGETIASLTLTGAMLPLIGTNTLSITATNAHGSATKSVNVEKLSPPVLSDLLGMILASNETKTISSSVVGTSPISYSWKNSSGTEVGTGAALTLTGNSFDLAGMYTYRLTVSNSYGSATKSVTVTVTRSASNTISALTANFSNVQTEVSINSGETRILTPGNVTYSITVSGYPRQTIEWIVVHPVTLSSTVVQTVTTSKESTVSETFTLTRLYTAANIRERIQAVVTNGTSDVKRSNTITVDTAEEIRSAFNVRYAGTFTAPSSPVYSVTTGFTANAGIPSSNIITNPIYQTDTYIMLWGDIKDERESGVIRTGSLLRSIDEKEIPSSYLDRYRISYSYKLPGESAFTPITTSSSFYAGNINPLMFVIDRSKFPGLKNQDDTCVFRCEINHVDTTRIGSKAAIYDTEITVLTMQFITNEAGELTNILGGNITTLEIPTNITSIASNFRENLKGTYSGGDSYDRGHDILTLILHKHITNIGERAFYDVRNLTKITGMPTNAIIGKNAFDTCTNLEEVLFDTS